MRRSRTVAVFIVLLKWSALERLSNSDFYLLKCRGLDQSGCAAKVGADGASPSIVFSKGAAAPPPPTNTPKIPRIINRFSVDSPYPLGPRPRHAPHQPTPLFPSPSPLAASKQALRDHFWVVSRKQKNRAMGKDFPETPLALPARASGGMGFSAQRK